MSDHDLGKKVISSSDRFNFIHTHSFANQNGIQDGGQIVRDRLQRILLRSIRLIRLPVTEHIWRHYPIAGSDPRPDLIFPAGPIRKDSRMLVRGKTQIAIRARNYERGKILPKIRKAVDAQNGQVSLGVIAVGDFIHKVISPPSGQKCPFVGERFWSGRVHRWI